MPVSAAKIGAGGSEDNIRPSGLQVNPRQERMKDEGRGMNIPENL
jgi:hypothetical protein